VQATVGSADRGRSRARGAVDELVDTVDDLQRLASRLGPHTRCVLAVLRGEAAA
jgi:hypothetical protein